MQEFGLVGSYKEDLTNHQTVNWEVGPCSEIGACTGQYGSFLSYEISTPGTVVGILILFLSW